MLLSERVREIGVEHAAVSDETVAVARQSLMREMARSVKPERARRHRRAWAGIGIGGLVAGAAVTAIVVGSVVAPVEAPSASAAVFERAAAGAEESATPLASGQYLRIATAFSWVVRWDVDMPEGARFNNADPDDAEAALRVEDTMITYVPSDQDADWVRERIPYELTEGFGARAAEAEKEWLQTNQHPGLAGVTRYPGGVAEAGGGDGGTFEYRLDGADEYADMPEDVPGIIAWFSERYEGEGDSNGIGHYFVETISDVGVFNLAPPEARAGMLRAFSTLDDVEVVRQEADLTTLRYERRNGDGERSVIEFVLDEGRGYVVEVVSWPFGSDMSAAADGSPGWTSRTVADITTVDAAP